jgi:hypothetical protein
VDLLIKLIFGLLGFMIRKIIKFGLHYLRYAIPGVVKVLYNPKYAVTALTVCLLSVVDAKFFYNTYTFNNYKYSNYVHLIILLAPFAYFYGLGKTTSIEKDTKEKVVYREPERVYIEPQLKQPIYNVYINQPNSQVENKLGWEAHGAKEAEVIDIKTIEREEDSNE